MSRRKSRGSRAFVSHSSRLAFSIISLMHDNPFLPLFRNPNKLLKAAGVSSGQKILEVGCGPGFFTIPAAEIVGDAGSIYAVDVNPLAIERVQKRIERQGIRNVKALLSDASHTALPNQSIDLVFVFGLWYVAGGLRDLVTEIYRVLRSRGILALEKSLGEPAIFRSNDELAYNVDRLKAIGEGQDPAVVATAWEVLSK